MLWCHAYNASNARDFRDACFRRPDRLEVGRRQRCDALLGSCRSGRHPYGAERELRGLLGAPTIGERLRACFKTESSGRGSAIRQPRDLEARGRRYHSKYRRSGGCEYAHRTGVASWSLSELVLGWSPRTGSLGLQHRTLVDGGATRGTQPDRGDYRPARDACSGERAGELYRLSGFRRKPAGRACVTHSTEATSEWPRRLEQVAHEPALVCRVERRTRSHQSIDQSTGQTGTRARTKEAVGSSASFGVRLSPAAAQQLPAQAPQADCIGLLASTP
jgi:hypothetical protein